MKKKRENRNYPDKPFAKMVFFPIALGIVFTLIMDVFKGIMIYQFMLFAAVAFLLYWIFYVFNKK
ncbi:MAG: hypothetical protein PHC92_01655 [Syntrophomonadaceae bacterium]|nr:hypothetical protein [Syntrophomonadaceae bacterium]